MVERTTRSGHGSARRTYQSRGWIAASVSGCVLALLGCSSGSEQSLTLGYEHNVADTLRVLVPVCEDETLVSVDLRVESADENLPGTGVDVPTENGIVNFLIGYPHGGNSRTTDLWLNVVTTRDSYDVHIPPADNHEVGQWLASGTGEPITAAELREQLPC